MQLPLRHRTVFSAISSSGDLLRRIALEDVITPSLPCDATRLRLPGVKDKDTTTTKEAAMQTQKTETSFVRPGVLPGVVHLAIDVAEKGQSTAIAVLQDARIELRAAVEQGIELAEKVTAAGFRFARKAVQRIDDAAGETLAGAE